MALAGLTRQEGRIVETEIVAISALWEFLCKVGPAFALGAVAWRFRP